METKNLILRRMNHGDSNDLYQMRKDPRMHKHTDTKPDEDMDETKAYIEKMNKGIDENKWTIWAIEHKKANRVIGTISIWNLNGERKSGELGYGIIPEYQGQGLMREALLSTVEYGFTVMGLKELSAYTEESNIKSVKLLESCNFTEAGRVDEEGYTNDKIYHMVVYKLRSQV